MFYSILLVGLIAAALYAVRRWQSLPEDKRMVFAKKALLYGSAAVILTLVLAGRAPWLMGVLAALLALFARIAQFAPYVPLFKKFFDEQTANGAKGNSPTVTSMSRQEAADILGVDINASEEEVRMAHKKLMQKIHPDRGGSDALAKQINAAKDVLTNS